MQAPLAFSARYLGGGAVLLVGLLKFGMLYVGSKLFAPQEKLNVGGFPPDHMALCQGAISGESVSQPFLSVQQRVLSHSAKCRSHLISRSLSEGIAQCVAVHSLCQCEEEYL